MKDRHCEFIERCGQLEFFRKYKDINWGANEFTLRKTRLLFTAEGFIGWKPNFLIRKYNMNASISYIP